MGLHRIIRGDPGIVKIIQCWRYQQYLVQLSRSEAKTTGDIHPSDYDLFRSMMKRFTFDEDTKYKWVDSRIASKRWAVRPTQNPFMAKCCSLLYTIIWLIHIAYALTNPFKLFQHPIHECKRIQWNIWLIDMCTSVVNLICCFHYTHLLLPLLVQIAQQDALLLRHDNWKREAIIVSNQSAQWYGVRACVHVCSLWSAGWSSVGR